MQLDKKNKIKDDCLAFAKPLLPAGPSKKPKCYNCKFASSAFKIAAVLEHHSFNLALPFNRITRVQTSTSPAILQSKC